MSYNWQQKGWPDFQFSPGILDEFQVKFLLKSGKVSGQFAWISEDQKEQYLVEMLLSEAIKTSAIEGEFLSREDVMSSLKKNLGIHEDQPKFVKDHRAKGIAKLMVEVRKSWSEALTQAKLFAWHDMLMEGNRYVNAGTWRTGTEPMQVVSGALGKEVVHFEAPPAVNMTAEMNRFFDWFNQTAPGGAKVILNPILRAAITHLYFESIHPFEDGNGRIGRALAEKALHQGLGQPILISLSSVIEAKKQNYYDGLKAAQQSLQIDSWLLYFAEVVMKAQENAEQLIEFSLQKAKFFDRFKTQLNDRELKAVNRMLDEGPDGFKGGMNAKKYMSLTGASKATATRDLQNMRDLGVLVAEGRGRSVCYQLNLES